MKNETIQLFESWGSSSRIISVFKFDFLSYLKVCEDRMICIQKITYFILLDKAIYLDRAFSITWWLRKCVWIQRMLRPYALQYWEFNLSFERIKSIQWSSNYSFHNEFYLLLPGPINSINGWLSLLNHNSSRNDTILPMIFISETIRQWVHYACMHWSF